MNRPTTRQTNRRHLIFFTAVLCLAWLAGGPLATNAQDDKPPLSPTDITDVLRYDEIPLAERNRLLLEDERGVKKNGVDFILTPALESVFKALGASDELIEAIRQNGPEPAADPDAGAVAAEHRKRGNEHTLKGEYDQAIAEYDKAISTYPEDAVAFYSRGFAYHYKNDLIKAFADYKTAIRMDPSLASQPILQCVLYNSEDSKNPDKALEECTQTIDQSADFALAYYIRANAYLDKKDSDRALADYDQFIKLNPTNTAAYIKRGDTYFEKKTFDRALADYTKAIELDPEQAEVYLKRARVYEQTEDLEKAVADLKNAVRLDPGNQAVGTNLKRLEDRIAELERQRAEAEKPPPEFIQIGFLSSAQAVNWTQPVYPATARDLRLQGRVVVEVEIDTEGNVTAATVTEGHKLFHKACEQAALKSKFRPAVYKEQPIKARGYIVYDFIL